MSKQYPENPKEFTEIGGSPVSGLTLSQVLRGHTDDINRIAWSPDGRFLASPSADKTIRIWGVAQGECTAVLEGHKTQVNSVAWSRMGICSLQVLAGMMGEARLESGFVKHGKI